MIICSIEVIVLFISGRAAGIATEKNEPSLIQKLAQASLVTRDVKELDPSTGAVRRKKNTMKDVKTAQNVAVAKKKGTKSLTAYQHVSISFCLFCIVD